VKFEKEERNVKLNALSVCSAFSLPLASGIEQSCLADASLVSGLNDGTLPFVDVGSCRSVTFLPRRSNRAFVALALEAEPFFFWGCFFLTLRIASA